MTSVIQNPIGNIIRNPVGPNSADTLWQLTDIVSAAHDWDADLGLDLTGSVINSWADQIAGTELAISGSNRPKLTNDGQNIVDMTPDGFGKILTVGGDTAQPALPALNKTTGYIAIVFTTTQASGGGLVSFDNVAAVLPYWSGSPLMYGPDPASDAVLNLGNSDVVFNQWHMLTLNFKSDATIYRLDGVEIYSGAAKAYNFDRFCLNRRISTGVVGYNKFKRFFVANDGVSDADNLYVEGYLASKYGI